MNSCALLKTVWRWSLKTGGLQNVSRHWCTLLPCHFLNWLQQGTGTSLVSLRTCGAKGDHYRLCSKYNSMAELFTWTNKNTRNQNESVYIDSENSLRTTSFSKFFFKVVLCRWAATSLKGESVVHGFWNILYKGWQAGNVKAL